MKKIFKTVKKNVKDLKYHIPETIGLFAISLVAPITIVVMVVRVVSAAGVA